jgi:hypothetical protein
MTTLQPLLPLAHTILFPFLLLLLLLLALAPPALALGDPLLVASLQCVYRAWGGAGWRSSAGWSSSHGAASSSPCSWLGVGCSAGGAITSLQLQGNGLAGNFTDGLACLTPAQASGIVTLNLDFNSLGGSVPSFAGWDALQVVSMYANKITGVPAAFQAPRLLTMRLSNNDIYGQHPDFSLCPGIEIISFDSCNKMYGPVPSYSAFVNLTFLSLGVNQFTGPIPSFANNTKLRYLWLYSNPLGGQIPALNANLQLEQIYMNDNMLTGPLPDVSMLANLKTLVVGSNSLSGDLSLLSIPQTVLYIDLSRNQFFSSAGFPNFDDGSETSMLGYLDLSYNNIGGNIPLAWGRYCPGATTGGMRREMSSNVLYSLTTLKCSSCNLTGSALDALDRLGTFYQLTSITLSKNNLAGSLSSHHFHVITGAEGSCRGAPVLHYGPNLLAALDISSNRITGSLPSFILYQLKTIDISNNPGISGYFYAWNMQYQPVSLRCTGTSLRHPNDTYPPFVGLNTKKLVSHANFTCPSLTSNNQFWCRPIEETLCDLPFSASVSVSFAFDPSYTGFKYCMCNAGYGGARGVCSPCSPGTAYMGPAAVYASMVNSPAPVAPAVCAPCPAGSYSKEPASVACTVAADGQYVALAGQTGAQPCPAFASCSHGAVVSEAGFWTSVDPARGVASTWRCSRSRCLAGACGANRRGQSLDVGAGAGSAFNPTFISGAYAGNPLCGACRDGLIEVLGSCTACSAADTTGLAVLVLMLYAATMGMLVVSARASHNAAASDSTNLKLLSWYATLAVQHAPTSGLTFYLNALELSLTSGSPSGASDSYCLLPLDGIANELPNLLLPFVLGALLLLTFGLDWALARWLPRCWLLRLCRRAPTAAAAAPASLSATPAETAPSAPVAPVPPVPVSVAARPLQVQAQVSPRSEADIETQWIVSPAAAGGKREGASTAPPQGQGQGQGQDKSVAAGADTDAADEAEGRASGRASWPVYLRSLLMLVIMSYSAIVDSALAVLNCVQVNGSLLNFAYPQTRCDVRLGGPYLPWFAAALAALLLCVVAFPWLLVWSTSHVAHPSAGDDGPHALRRRRYILGAVLDCYRPEYSWYEAPSMLRRVVYLALSRFLLYYPSVRTSCLSLAVGIMFIAHVRMQPYREAAMNRMEARVLANVAVLSLFADLDDTSNAAMLISLLSFAAAAADFVLNLRLWKSLCPRKQTEPASADADAPNHCVHRPEVFP